MHYRTSSYPRKASRKSINNRSSSSGDRLSSCVDNDEGHLKGQQEGYSQGRPEGHSRGRSQGQPEVHSRGHSQGQTRLSEESDTSDSAPEVNGNRQSKSLKQKYKEQTSRRESRGKQRRVVDPSGNYIAESLNNDG